MRVQEVHTVNSWLVISNETILRPCTTVLVWNQAADERINPPFRNDHEQNLKRNFEMVLKRKMDFKGRWFMFKNLKSIPKQFCEEALWNLIQIKNYVYYLKIDRVILSHLICHLWIICIVFFMNTTFHMYFFIYIFRYFTYIF